MSNVSSRGWRPASWRKERGSAKSLLPFIASTQKLRHYHGRKGTVKLFRANLITEPDPDQDATIVLIACSSLLDLRGNVRIKRRMTITTETERVLIVQKRRIETLRWCEGCGEPVNLVTPETAATMTGLSVRAICRMVESNKVHFSETPSGSLLICLNSLPRLNEEFSRLPSAE